MARSELTRLTGSFNGPDRDDDCPNVYRTAEGSIVVQGACPTPSSRRRVRAPWRRSPKRCSGRPYVLLDGDEWRRAFDAYEREAWRFEAQPTYAMPSSRVARGTLTPGLPRNRT